MKQDMEKAETLNATFSLVLTSKESQRTRKKFRTTGLSGFIFIPGKVREQLIPETISGQLTDKKNTKSSQCGFAKGESCLTSLL